MLTVFRELSAVYLVLTLAATSLAKARTWQSTKATMLSERTIPYRYVTLVLGALIVVELGGAIWIASRVAPTTIGLLAAALFVAFGVYKVVTGLRRGIVGCSCAGPTTSYIATIPGIIATALASLVQATLAVIYAVVPPTDVTALAVMPLLALTVTFAVFVAFRFREGQAMAQDVSYEVERSHA